MIEIACGHVSRTHLPLATSLIEGTFSSEIVLVEPWGEFEGMSNHTLITKPTVAVVSNHPSRKPWNLLNGF